MNLDDAFNAEPDKGKIMGDFHRRLAEASLPAPVPMVALTYERICCLEAIIHSGVLGAANVLRGMLDEARK